MKNKRLNNISLFLLIIGFIVFIISVMWTLKISFYFLRLNIGLPWSIASFLCAPLLIILVPWYLLLVQGQWSPILISYGGWFIAYIIISAGRAFYNISSDDKI
ncbi:hypothetical protein J7L67_07365 [bacterium]|nr:hypothetical protein [bacterium]